MKPIRAAALFSLALLTVAVAQPDRPGPLPPGHPGIPAATPTPAPPASPEDVASIDAIVGAMYDALNGAPGEARDWDRYWSLFAPDARLVSARPGPDGRAWAMVLTAKDFQDANKRYFEKGGRIDHEIARRTERFGNIAHIWSTYETRYKAEDAEPYTRGINSIQLLKDGDRWWIVNVFWEFERPESAIPEEYLTSPPK